MAAIGTTVTGSFRVKVAPTEEIITEHNAEEELKEIDKVSKKFTSC
jgi:hypothetical protein